MVKRFSRFLTEAKTSFSAGDFAYILTHIDADKANAIRDRYLPKMLPMLNEYAPASEIPNPTFNDLKDYANRVIDVACDQPEWLVAMMHKARGDSPYRSDALYGFDVWKQDIASASSANLIAGKLKKAESLMANASTFTDLGKAYVTHYVSVLRELAPLADAVMALKDKAVKRQPKPQETVQQKYQNAHRTMAMIASGPAVTKVLTELTNDIKDDYATAVTNGLVRRVEPLNSLSDEEFVKNINDSYRRIGRLPDALKSFMFLWNSVEVEVSGRRVIRYRLKSDYRSLAAQYGKDQAELMQRQFLVKNVGKLVSIIDAKNKRDVALDGDPKILSTNARRFEGDIRFTFTDGSSFKVRNKVVLKYSQYGTPFNQYPTTFHDVVMPDGTSMGMPSEERMNEVFTKA